jgi:hypothetical protein
MEARPRPSGPYPGKRSGRTSDRNVIERAFCAPKQWRGLATRYDKLAITYRGGVVPNGVAAWLRVLGMHNREIAGRPGSQPRPQGIPRRGRLFSCSACRAGAGSRQV